MSTHGLDVARDWVQHAKALARPSAFSLHSGLHSGSGGGHTRSHTQQANSNAGSATTTDSGYTSFQLPVQPPPVLPLPQHLEAPANGYNNYTYSSAHSPISSWTLSPLVSSGGTAAASGSAGTTQNSQNQAPRTISGMENAYDHFYGQGMQPPAEAAAPMGNGIHPIRRPQARYTFAADTFDEYALNVSTEVPQAVADLPTIPVTGYQTYTSFSAQGMTMAGVDKTAPVTSPTASSTSSGTTGFGGVQAHYSPDPEPFSPVDKFAQHMEQFQTLHAPPSTTEGSKLDEPSKHQHGFEPPDVLDGQAETTQPMVAATVATESAEPGLATRKVSDSYNPNSDRFSFQMKQSATGSDDSGKQRPSSQVLQDQPATQSEDQQHKSQQQCWPNQVDQSPASVYLATSFEQPQPQPQQPPQEPGEGEDIEPASASVGNLSTIPEEPAGSAGSPGFGPSTLGPNHSSQPVLNTQKRRSLVADGKKVPALVLNSTPKATEPKSSQSPSQSGPKSAPPIPAPSRIPVPTQSNQSTADLASSLRSGTAATDKVTSGKSHSRTPSWRHQQQQPATISGGNTRHQRRSTFSNMLSRNFFRPTSKLAREAKFDDFEQSTTSAPGIVVEDEDAKVNSTAITSTTEATAVSGITRDDDENTTMAALPDASDIVHPAGHNLHVKDGNKLPSHISKVKPTPSKGVRDAETASHKSRAMSALVPPSPAVSSRTTLSVMLPSQQPDPAASPNSSARTLNAPTVHADDEDWWRNEDLVNWMHGQAHWAEKRERSTTGRESVSNGRRRGSHETKDEDKKLGIPIACFHSDRDSPSRVGVTVDHAMPASPTSVTAGGKLYLHVLDIWNKGLPFDSTLAVTLNVNSHPRGPISGMCARNERRGYNASARFSEALLLDVREHSTVEITIWAKLPANPNPNHLPKIPSDSARKKRHRLFSHRAQPEKGNNSVLGLWGGNGPAQYQQPPAGPAHGAVRNSFSISKMLSRSTTASTLYFDNHLALPPANPQSSMLSTSSSTTTGNSISHMAGGVDTSESMVVSRLTLDIPSTLFRNEARTFPLAVTDNDAWTHALCRFDALAKVSNGTEKEKKKAVNKAASVAASQAANGATMLSAEVTLKMGVYEEFQGERLARVSCM